MKTDTLKIEITFTEPVLGSSPANKEVYQDFIASRSPTISGGDEEVLCVEEEVEKATTVFPKDEKGLFMWDYQFKGFLKESIGVLTELGETKLSKWTFKRVVDSCLFVNPRRIHLLDNDGNPILESDSYNERPLRATTMQGDRIALARSEQIESGCKAILTIDLLESTNAKSKFSALTMDVVKAALDYGRLKGCGQWRNGSYGRFVWGRME